MLYFPYQEEKLAGSPPPSLFPAARVRWRPLISVRIIGPTGRYQDFSRAVLDPGSDDTIFPAAIGSVIDAMFRSGPTYGIRWRGQGYPLQFADVELQVADDIGTTCRWPAVVGFSPAPIRYPLLGIAGCLEFFDAKFRGADRIIELETNSQFPGTES